MDIETAGLDPFRHPALAGGIVTMPGVGVKPRTQEYLLGPRGIYTAAGRVPKSAAERLAMERGLLGAPRTRPRYLNREQMLATMDPWAKKNILPYIQELEAAGTEAITPRHFYNKFANEVSGKIGLIQNAKFESRFLGYQIPPAEYQRLARTASFASKDYRYLRMVPEGVEESIRKAFKTGTLDDWWSVFSGKGGIRKALTERQGKTMILDLQDITKSMFAGLQKAGLMKSMQGDVFTGSAVNILELAAGHNTEAHRAVADGIVELDIMQRHLSISEKLHRSLGRSIDPSSLFTTSERKYIQRLDNVREWLKFSSLEKSFAEMRLQAETGRGVPLVVGTMDPMKRQVFEDGVEKTKLLSNIPIRRSSRTVAERALPHAGLAERLAYEKKLVFDRWTEHLPEEMLPKARGLWAKIWRMDQDELVALTQAEKSAQSILARMEGTGAWGGRQLKQELIEVAQNNQARFSRMLKKTPTWLKAGAAIAAGIMAVGAMTVSPDEDKTTVRATSYPYATIEGIRRSESAYNRIGGIYASYLPHANVSDFGSGYDYTKSAIRGAYRLFAHAKEALQGFAIEFSPRSMPQPGGILKPQALAKEVNFPIDVPVPHAKVAWTPEMVPSVHKAPRRMVFPKYQAPQAPSLAVPRALDSARRVAAAKTKAKLVARQAPGKHIYTQSKQGIGPMVTRATTDFGSPRDPANRVSTAAADAVRETRLKEGARLKMPQAEAASAWIVDRPAWERFEVNTDHLAQVEVTARNKMPTGVGSKNSNRSFGAIMNKFSEDGVSAGTTTHTNLEFRERKNRGEYLDLLSAVGNRAEVVKGPKPSEIMRAQFYQGKAGILNARPIQHRIGSQHLRLGGQPCARRSHPVRSRAMRSNA